jgi:hypothetical protein
VFARIARCFLGIPFKVIIETHSSSRFPPVSRPRNLRPHHRNCDHRQHCHYSHRSQPPSQTGSRFRQKPNQQPRQTSYKATEERMGVDFLNFISPSSSLPFYPPPRATPVALGPGAPTKRVCRRCDPSA